MRADGQGSNPIVQHLDELICCIKFTFEEVHRHKCKQRVEVFVGVSCFLPSHSTLRMIQYCT